MTWDARFLALAEHIPDVGKMVRKGVATVETPCERGERIVHPQAVVR